MIGYRASQLPSREIEIGTERDRSISIHGFNTATTAVQVSYPRGSLNTTQVRLHQCLKKQPKNGTFLCQPHHRKRKEEGPWNSALQPVWDLPTEWRYLTSDVGKKAIAPIIQSWLCHRSTCFRSRHLAASVGLFERWHKASYTLWWNVVLCPNTENIWHEIFFFPQETRCLQL